MTRKLGDYLTMTPAAKILGVNPRTLRFWAKTGKVKCIISPVNNKFRLFLREDLEEILDRLNK